MTLVPMLGLAGDLELLDVEVTPALNLDPALNPLDHVVDCPHTHRKHVRNFLSDEQILARIADIAEVTAEDEVLEVGPIGSG